MAIDWSKFALPKGPSRFAEKQQRKTDTEKQHRDCNRLVDLRDHRICRVCGRPSNPEGIGLLERGHRHHLVYRSQGGLDESRNVLTLCAGCHDEVHVKGTLRLEGDADQRDSLTQKLNGVAVYRTAEHGWQIQKWV
jgi:hypothetical protein